MATIVKGKNANKPYTVRYYYEGKQREKSFATRKQATDWKVKFEHDSREQTFVDPKVAGEKFAAVAERWLALHPGSPKTKRIYESALRMHILPVFGSKPLTVVANEREAVEVFVRHTLPGKGLGASVIRTCYVVINAIVNDAIKAGRLKATRLRGIELPSVQRKAGVVFASHEQINEMAANMPEGYESTIYLMRGCGLRLGEALGRHDIRGDTLRLTAQLDPTGKAYKPLKHRGEGDYRDIPLPRYVAAVYNLDDGTPAVNHRTYSKWFSDARDAAGLPPNFTPHTLRHIFASVALAGGVPITDVSKWLGHNNIQVTFGIYGHLIPGSFERAREVLDREWEGKQ